MTRPSAAPSGFAMELAAEEIGPGVLVRLNQEQLAKLLDKAVQRAGIDVAFNRAEVSEHRLRTHRAESALAGVSDPAAVRALVVAARAAYRTMVNCEHCGLNADMDDDTPEVIALHRALAAFPDGAPEGSAR